MGAKHMANLKIVKLKNGELKKANYNIKMSIEELQDKGLIITLSRSQLIDWLLEFKGTTWKQLDLISKKLRGKKKLDELLFINEICQVEFKSQDEFDHAVKGFTINGIEYSYLLNKGTKTVTFARVDLVEWLLDKLNGNRDKSVPQYASKLSAYQHLTMSSSVPVSKPTKVCVLPDIYNTFNTNYLHVTPNTIEHREKEVTRNINDGCGFIHPQQAIKWSKELNQQNVVSVFQIRQMFTKGCVATFDYKQWLLDNGHDGMVKDVWGNEVNLFDCDLVLFESLVKLWSSYTSCEDWLANASKFGYEWRCSKYSKTTAKIGYTNYQILQPFNLSDDDIRELIKPSIDEYRAITGDDYDSTIKYLLGEQDAEDYEGEDLIKALTIEPQLIYDKALRTKIKGMLEKTRNDIKLGRVKLELGSRQQIIIPDLIMMMEGICGKSLKGMLGEYEIYSKFHIDNGVKEAIAIRNPMLVENNLVKVKVTACNEYKKYLTYLDDCIIVDGCSLINESLCGFDMDGDSLQLTSNPVLLRKHKKALPIKCEGITAPKVICENLEVQIKSARLMCKNNGVPNVGSVINKAQQIFVKRSEFCENSNEYKELTDRLVKMVCISQSVIDATKSGAFFPIPKHWINQNDCESVFDESICAEKKPYFFIYNYDKLKSQYQELVNVFNVKTIAHYGIECQDVIKSTNEEHKKLTDYYSRLSDVAFIDNTTVSRLCHIAKKEISKLQYSDKFIETKELLMSDTNILEKEVETQALKFLKEHQEKEKKVYSTKSLLDEHTKHNLKQEAKQELLLKLLELCDYDSVLACDYLISVAYNSSKGNGLCFELFGAVIISNLLSRKLDQVA